MPNGNGTKRLRDCGLDRVARSRGVQRRPRAGRVASRTGAVSEGHSGGPDSFRVVAAATAAQDRKCEGGENGGDVWNDSNGTCDEGAEDGAVGVAADVVETTAADDGDGWEEPERATEQV